jgi:hypothetical protein
MLLLEDRRFYVNIYLDPRKPGKYVYGEYEFDYEPFYVGKGHGERKNSHILWAIKTNYNSYKFNKIRIIIEERKKPIIKEIKNNLNEKESYKLEKKIIKTIGRIDLETGPLTNLTDGGEGNNNNLALRRAIATSNRKRPLELRKMIALKGGKTRKENELKMSSEEKQKLKEKRKKTTLIARSKMSKQKLKILDDMWIYNRKGKKDNEERKKIKSKAHLDYVNSLTSEERKFKYGHNKGMKMSEEQKIQISNTKKANPQIISDETRKKISEAGKRAIRTQETSKKLSEIQKERWRKYHEHKQMEKII